MIFRVGVRDVRLGGRALPAFNRTPSFNVRRFATVV
jgi:hypothetical protein